MQFVQIMAGDLSRRARALLGGGSACMGISLDGFTFSEFGYLDSDMYLRNVHHFAGSDAFQG